MPRWDKHTTRVAPCALAHGIAVCGAKAPHHRSNIGTAVSSILRRVMPWDTRVEQGSKRCAVLHDCGEKEEQTMIGSPGTPLCGHGGRHRVRDWSDVSVPGRRCHPCVSSG